jgi:hypothetical protein
LAADLPSNAALGQGRDCSHAAIVRRLYDLDISFNLCGYNDQMNQLFYLVKRPAKRK